jgi:glycosyltransferase involved in cell wall biosynthesis
MTVTNLSGLGVNSDSRDTKNLSISVVVPVYNSEKSLPELVLRLEPALSGLTDRFELILVNDGSRDRSGKIMEELAMNHRWIKCINLLRNYGQHNALLCGIREASFNFIVTMDDDLQHPPEEIIKLVNRIQEGYDVVFGTPEHEKHGFWRDLTSQITKLALQSTMGVESARSVSPFRIFRSKVRESFSSYQGPFPNIDVLLTWGTACFSAVPVRFEPRLIGKSNYNLRKLVIHALNMITGYSVLPLQVASIIGFIFTLFGLGVLGFVLTRFILDQGKVPVQGFTFIASVIAIFSGAQLFALGIMGEYLARIYFRMMDRPSYSIERKYNFQDSQDEASK